LAAAIKQKLGVDVEMIKGGGGIFDVVVDGRCIFCKHDTGRFPTDDEVLAKLS
jgi:predicted Rdx family selenoprotein